MNSHSRILMRALIVFSTLLNCSIGILALWFFFRPGAVHLPLFHPPRVVSPPAVEYKDFVAILLTALGVMIALGSVALAALAIFGYAEGVKMIERLVQREVERLLPPSLARAQFESAGSQTSPAEADEIARALEGDHAAQ